MSSPDNDLKSAFDNLLTEVARTVRPTLHPAVWDAITKLEEQIYPENFEPTKEELDEYFDDRGCECEIDWHCGCGNHPMVRDDARLMAMAAHADEIVEPF